MFSDLSKAAQTYINWELGNIPGRIIVAILLIVFGAARLSRQPVSQEPAEV